MLELRRDGGGGAMRVTMIHDLVTAPHFFAHKLGGTISVSVHINGEPSIEMRKDRETSSSVAFEVELCASEELALRLEALAGEVRASADESVTGRAVAP